MRTNHIARGLKFVLLAGVGVAVVGLVVTSLWNWLAPELFGWPEISFGKALGLLVLSKILFGGFRGRPGWHIGWRHRWAERWEQMTPEERENFRAGMRTRCGPPVRLEPDSKN